MTKTLAVILSRSLLLVIFFGFGCVKQEPKTPIHTDKEDLDDKSAATFHGLRLSIKSLEWKEGALQGTFCTAFVSNEDNNNGRDLWAIDPPWFFLYAHFWDHEGNPIKQKPETHCLHNRDFIMKRIDFECHHFVIQVPPNASYLAMQYGTGPEWHLGRDVSPYSSVAEST